jgi:hypothetical protein
MHNPDIIEISRKASCELCDILNRKIDNVTGVCRDSDKWIATVDVVERNAIPDTQDLIGTYEVQLNDSMNVMSYRRTGVRRRGDSIFEEVAP